MNFSYLKPLPVVGGWCHLNILGALSSSFWVTLCHHPHLSKVPPPVPDGRLDWNWYWDSCSRKYRKKWNLGRKKKGKIVNRSTTKGLQGWLKEKANQWKEDCLLSGWDSEKTLGRQIRDVSGARSKFHMSQPSKVTIRVFNQTRASYVTTAQIRRCTLDRNASSAVLIGWLITDPSSGQLTQMHNKTMTGP